MVRRPGGVVARGVVHLSADRPLLRRADLRFVLATRPATAVVLGPVEGWAHALQRAGTSLTTGSSVPELVVAPGELATRAASLGAEQVLLEGEASTRALRAHGYATQRILVLPSATRPELAVPLDDLRAVRRAIGQRLAAAPRWGRIRGAMGLAALVLSRGRIRRGSVVTVGRRQPSLPFALQASTQFGVPANASWQLLFGRGDDLQRIVFLVSRRGSPTPSWAVKIARVEGLDSTFERDARGLGLIAMTEPHVAARAPRLVGRSQVEGLCMSVETAAAGDRLSDVLRRGGHRCLPLVEAVAAWVVELARTTGGPAGELTDELERLRSVIAPVWEQRISVVGLLDLLPPVAPVLQHNDLGTWNIVAAGSTFTAVDWESAAPAGLPLWDLVYFLADASAQLEGQAGRGLWSRHVAALLRGEAPLSSLVFAWVRRAVDATGIPEAAVGPIMTLGWLHHGASHLVRAESMRGLTGTASDDRPEILELAERWLDDPVLGPGWALWR